MSLRKGPGLGHFPGPLRLMPPPRARRPAGSAHRPALRRRPASSPPAGPERSAPTGLLAMAKTRGFQFSLVLWIAVLPACVSTAPGAPGRGDSHSLHYDFNISFVEPRCMVQVTMDEEKYLLYDCGINKVISMNLPGEAGKAIPSCKGELDTLSNMGNELKPLLPDIKQEKYPYGAPLTLQVRMTCHGSIHRSLEFSLRGQRLLTFHSETGEYEADNSEGERLKKKWENNEDLNKHFQMTLKGDCNKLHQCWVHRRTELETTASPTTVPAPDPATPTIASASPTKTSVRWMLWASIILIDFVIFISLVIFCPCCNEYRKSLQEMLL